MEFSLQSRSRVATSRFQQANRRGNGRHFQLARLGISVFMDFISKRIHCATHKEAFLDGYLYLINGEKVAIPPPNGSSNVSPIGSEKLVEIPIVSASASTKASLGSSGSITPVLDKKSGMFTIRPKNLRIQS
ncbi:hypothetical protein V6N11_051909 [Hibiscus sabdariffa]|uniref:Uncharacterized protein n=1 Tax=Hibiscus sabdariffa TaxID=183260 RepID=A0ABR2U8J9_9ROSI